MKQIFLQDTIYQQKVPNRTVFVDKRFDVTSSVGGLVKYATAGDKL